MVTSEAASIYDRTSSACAVERPVRTLDEVALARRPLAFRLPFPRRNEVERNGRFRCEAQTDGVPLVEQAHQRCEPQPWLSIITFGQRRRQIVQPHHRYRVNVVHNHPGWSFICDIIRVLPHPLQSFRFELQFNHIASGNNTPASSAKTDPFPFCSLLRSFLWILGQKRLHSRILLALLLASFGLCLVQCFLLFAFLALLDPFLDLVTFVVDEGFLHR